jgi:hypothetical protein
MLRSGGNHMFIRKFISKFLSDNEISLTGKFNAYNKILSVVVTVAFAIIYFFLPDKIPALHHGSELIYVPKLFGVILPPMFIILIQLILSLQNRLNKINNVLLACVAIGMFIYYLRWI